MISRRQLLQVGAALPLLASVPLRAQSNRRVYTTSIALEDERVWIAAKIGDSRPLQFVVDTGGVVSLIQENVARELGLRSAGALTMHGSGGRERMLFYRARNILFASGLREAEAVFGAAPAGFGFGPDSAGSFAAGLFTAQDSDLDFDRGEWRLYPDGRGEWSGFEQLPSTISHVNGETGSAFIFVDAVLDGGIYRLLVDTGMPGQVTLTGRAARRSGLWNDAGPWAPHRGHGIGGETGLRRLVRAGRLSLGSIGFDRPLVALANPSSVQTSAMDHDGIVGLELLERLTLSTDVRARRLWARRNSRPARPERYGLTGLWADEQNGRVVIADVSPRSPAADAGIRVGDVVEAVDLRSFVRTLGGPPGRQVPIRLRRNGQVIETTLTLRTFL
jgi:serine protease Do